MRNFWLHISMKNSGTINIRGLGTLIITSWLNISLDVFRPLVESLLLRQARLAFQPIFVYCDPQERTIFCIGTHYTYDNKSKTNPFHSVYLFSIENIHIYISYDPYVMELHISLCIIYLYECKIITFRKKQIQKKLRHKAKANNI